MLELWSSIMLWLDQANGWQFVVRWCMFLAFFGIWLRALWIVCGLVHQGLIRLGLCDDGRPVNVWQVAPEKKAKTPAPARDFFDVVGAEFDDDFDTPESAPDDAVPSVAVLAAAEPEATPFSLPPWNPRNKTD